MVVEEAPWPGMVGRLLGGPGEECRGKGRGESPLERFDYRTDTVGLDRKLPEVLTPVQVLGAEVTWDAVGDVLGVRTDDEMLCGGMSGTGSGDGSL